MTDQLLTHPLVDVLDDLASPQSIHRLAARPLPDLHGTSRAIRADLGIQFRLNYPTEPDGKPGAVTIRYRSPIPIPGAEELAAPDALEAGMELTVRLVAMTRHHDAQDRVHERPVFDEVAEAWVGALFERNGLEIEDLSVSGRWRVGSSSTPTGPQATRTGRAKASASSAPRFTVRDVRARLVSTPSDPSPYLRGIGRGRAYGYGMLIAR